MSGFKEQVERDIAAVFHNTEEFAEEMEIGYNGEYYNVKAVLTEYSAKDRSDYDGDPAVEYRWGVFPVLKKLYVQFSELGFLPSINNRLEVNGISYDVIQSDTLMGENVIVLRRYDE